MTAQLRDEIRQNLPFRSLEQEAYLSLGRTWAALDHTFAEVLRPYDITPTQYNVLRILRGAGASGLCRAEVIDRMITRVPDATRLLDRMEAAGLITRERGADDRRFVTARITDHGLQLLAALDESVNALDTAYLGGLSPDELSTLIDMLGRIREAVHR